MGFGKRKNRSCRSPHRQSSLINENCICPSCNTVLPHKRGIPCFKTVCPNCGKNMARKFNTSSTDDLS